jgi:GxxExxY protein
MLLEQQITEAIIGAAIEVHRELGPGLLESAYEECFCHELHLHGLNFKDRLNSRSPTKVLN